MDQLETILLISFIGIIVMVVLVSMILSYQAVKTQKLKNEDKLKQRRHEVKLSKLEIEKAKLLAATELKVLRIQIKAFKNQVPLIKNDIKTYDITKKENNK